MDTQKRDARDGMSRREYDTAVSIGGSSAKPQQLKRFLALAQVINLLLLHHSSTQLAKPHSLPTFLLLLTLLFIIDDNILDLSILSILSAVSCLSLLSSFFSPHHCLEPSNLTRQHKKMSTTN